MGRISLPPDVQYLILAEFSRLERFSMSECDWTSIINLFCVCRQWYSSLRDLLIRNTRASTLLIASEGVGRLALERATADYLARENATGHAEDICIPPNRMPTAYSARQLITPEDLITAVDPLVSDLQDCLQTAAFSGYVNCLRIGFDAGFDYESVELLEPAIPGDHIAVLEFLFDGDYVNINQETEHTSVLGFAVLEEKIPMVEFLLTRGADPNIRVHSFVTEYQHSLSLVSYAGFKNNVELMKILLSHGLAVEDPEYHHRPIWWAVYHNNIDMARLLIEKGVDLSPSLHNDWPLYDAVQFGHAEMVILMLEEGGMPEDASEIVNLYYEIEVCGSVEVQRIFGREE